MSPGFFWIQYCSFHKFGMIDVFSGVNDKERGKNEEKVFWKVAWKTLEGFNFCGGSSIHIRHLSSNHEFIR